MRLLLTCTFLTLTAISQNATGTQDGADLVVLKFSWSKQHVVNDFSQIQAVRAVENRTVHKKDEPEAVRNNRDMQERGAELRAGEIDAARSAVELVEIYVYRMQVKNTGTRLVRSFVWEYQPSPDVRDPAARQFLCTVKAKANETKGLEVISPFAPSRVIAVANTGDNSKQKEKIVVNRINYGDGTVWQRTGWDTSILPATIEKVGAGKCVWL